MHAQISGTVDFHEKDDAACLERLRSLVALLVGPALRAASIAPGTARSAGPTETADGRRMGAPPMPHGISTNAIHVNDASHPSRDSHGRDAHATTGAPQFKAASNPSDVYKLFSPDGHAPYDIHGVLACIIDADSLQEYRAEFGKTVVCAYATIGGHPVGIVANQRQQVRTGRGDVQIGGVLYGDSADKAARFIMDCNQTGLPLIFFQDVMGFMVGADAEQHGIIRSGAKLVNAVSNSTVPKITIIIGGSFGAGSYALCGKAFDPTFIFAWPGARYAVMGADQATDTLVHLRLRQSERSGKKLAPDELEQLRQTTLADYQAQTDIRYGAARGWVDAIIAPHRTREVLIEAIHLATRPPPKGGFRTGVFQV